MITNFKIAPIPITNVAIYPASPIYGVTCIIGPEVIDMSIEELIRRYSKIYKRAISFREALDLTGLPVIIGS